MGPTKTYLGAFLTLGSVVLAFFFIVGLALGDCVTAECKLTDTHRPLWALGVIVGTVAANIAMWFLLSRGDRTDE
ncbi:MAG: hypothetical protein R3C31_06890 [Hyphomonadaceae bacterium]